MIAASACVKLSGLPFNGTLGAVKVGYDGNDYILNPSNSALKESLLDLTVAGTKNAVMMVESEAKELTEDVMLGAVNFGHEKMQVIITAIEELVADANVSQIDWTPPVSNNQAYEEFFERYKERITDAYSITKKQERNTKLSNIKTEIIESDSNEDEDIEDKISCMFEKAQKNIVRKRIIDGERRIDGRDTVTVRPIDVKVGILPRTHGSALFTRGETQALVVTTLGTGDDEQMIDSLDPMHKQHFMLHYNFPPYSVGEVGRVGATGRREIGHGKLAWRAVHPMLPKKEDFPYTLRLVSEITESNGSSSMATVCGSSLALMAAGVPIKKHIGGIAMGLIKEGDDFVVLSDILGDEDHLGDMDFKVAGTMDGITSLQMDIKITSITKEIMEIALNQASGGRKHIIGIMSEALPEARTKFSKHAPQVISITIDKAKIKDVIGSGGKVIKNIVEVSGAKLEVNDDGIVKIASSNEESINIAKQMVEDIVAEPEVGKVYTGKVVKIVEFGAFVNFMGARDGLLHVSQISQKRVENVSDVLSEGQEVQVKVLDVDRAGKVKLSMKEV